MSLDVELPRMYRTILVPTDGSEAAESAVSQAYEIAERFGATVHVLFVVDVDVNTPLSLSTEPVVESVRESGEELTSEIAEEAPEGVETVTVVEEGDPHERILEYAGAHDVDLIAMGTHGRRGLDRYLIGSVTERVVRSADCSVLVTRATEAAPAIQSADAAIDAARDALAEAGHEDVTIVEEPYEQAGYWIVRAEGDDRTFNVHVDRPSGDARIATIDRR